MSPPRRPVRQMANKLRYLRKSKGWSQTRLSLESNVGQDTISRIEKQDWLPVTVTCERLAEALGKNVQDIWPEIPQPQLEMEYTDGLV